jgi:hypothetical protein
MDLPSRLKIRYYPTNQLRLKGALGGVFQAHGYLKGGGET